MRKILSRGPVVVLALAMATAAPASLDQFSGKWKNADPQTRGITTLEVTVSKGRVKVHAWGKCHPTDCDWGEVDATAYAPDVQSPPDRSAIAVSAIYTTSFSRTILVIHPDGEDGLKVEALTSFTDSSGRSAYSMVEKFAR